MGARRKKKSSVFKVIVIIVIMILVAVIGFILYMNIAAEPFNAKDTKTVNIVIPQGSSTSNIADILAENNIINSTAVFKFQSKSKGYDGKFKAGEYSLSPSMSMIEIMDSLVGGKSNTKRFTIPEGYTIKQISERLAKEGLINTDTFAQEVELGTFDYRFLKDAPPGPNRLEGYLYPETYDVFSNATEHDIINRMLKQFNSLFTEEYYTKAQQMGLNINQVVTIASLIERETKVADERALVSSVIQNRLKAGMPLQIDATVQYALGETKARLSNADLKVNSPYNTYKIKGLPPGPICNPSIESIDAALNPANTDYLYYVLDPSLDGHHNFSNNYNKFLQDKDKYIKQTFGN